MTLTDDIQGRLAETARAEAEAPAEVRTLMTLARGSERAAVAIDLIEWAQAINALAETATGSTKLALLTAGRALIEAGEATFERRPMSMPRIEGPGRGPGFVS